jgi:hypothetical protein
VINAARRVVLTLGTAKEERSCAIHYACNHLSCYLQVRSSAAASSYATVLDADGRSIARNGVTGPAEVRDVAVDLSQRVSHERLGAVLGKGVSRSTMAVSPRCGPLGPRRAVRAGADSLVLEPEFERTCPRGTGRRGGPQRGGPSLVSAQCEWRYLTGNARCCA